MIIDPKYIVVPRIISSGCNLQTSPVTVAFPITAAAGFASVLLGKIQALNKPGIPAKPAFNPRFAVILHEYQCYQGQTKNPFGFCINDGAAPVESDLINPPLVPEIKGRVCFSIIIEWTPEKKSDGESIQPQQVDREVLALSFSGGGIELDGLQYQNSASKGLSQILSGEKLNSELNRIPSGWFIRDRRDLLLDKGDLLRELIDRSQSYDTGESAWLFATSVGYAVLEHPVKRQRMRSLEDGLKHAFCEPILSLAQLAFSRSLVRKYNGETAGSLIEEEFLTREKLLWSWKGDSTSYSYLAAD